MKKISLKREIERLEQQNKELLSNRNSTTDPNSDRDEQLENLSSENARLLEAQKK